MCVLSSGIVIDQRQVIIYCLGRFMPFDSTDSIINDKDEKNKDNFPKKHLLGLQAYLSQGPLEDFLSLEKNNLLYFHWANWEKTCLKQRENLESGVIQKSLKNLERQLEILKNEPVWIVSRRKILKINLYELYQCYLDSRVRMQWFQRKEEFLFSSEKSSGPFTTLSSMKWFDKDIYKLFIFRKILIDQLPLRKFRLNTSIYMNWRVNGSPLELCQVLAHQISYDGIVFKISNRSDLNKIFRCDYVEIDFITSVFKKNKKTEITLKNLKTNLDKNELQLIYLPKNKLSKTLKSWRGCFQKMNNFYVFLKYDDMFEEGDKIKKKIFSFLSCFEISFEERLNA